MQKRVSFLILPQQERYYPEGLTVFAGLDKFKDFPAPSVIYKEFQGTCEPCNRHLSRGGHFVSVEFKNFVYARLAS